MKAKVTSKDGSIYKGEIEITDCGVECYERDVGLKETVWIQTDTIITSRVKSIEFIEDEPKYRYVIFGEMPYGKFKGKWITFNQVDTLEEALDILKSEIRAPNSDYLNEWQFDFNYKIKKIKV